MQRLQREDLEQDATERIDIGATVERALSADLLRRDVARRAEDRPCDGLGTAIRHRTGPDAGVDVCEAAAVLASLLGDARNAPVEYVDLAEVAELNVRRLEIAMNDAARVREF